MTEEAKKKLEEGGVNVEEAMQRFMNNDKLLERFLIKFVSDESYGLSGLNSVISEQTDHLRGKDFDAAAEMMPRVTALYEEVLGVIKEVYGI